MVLQLTSKAKWISETVDSRQCEAITGVVQSEGIMVVARLLQPAELLIKAKSYAPKPLAKQISTALDTSSAMDRLYREHVLKKIGSSYVCKVALGINNHIVYESTSVAAFQPSGWMDPFILHGQCSIWIE